MMRTKLRATRVSRDSPRKMPTSIRPVVGAADIEVPEGHEVEPIMAGFSFPTAIELAPDGSLFVCEGGSTWPTRPVGPTRITPSAGGQPRLTPRCSESTLRAFGRRLFGDIHHRGDIHGGDAR
jgi:hypothetical protein